jgi:hypothetical protein
MNHLTQHDRISARSIAVSTAFLALVISASGCADRGGNPSAQDDSKKSETLDSAHRLLGKKDIAAFVPGTKMEELLDAFQWRGNLEAAVNDNGHELSAISFNLYETSPLEDVGGTVVWAIFSNREYVKCVAWPKWEDPNRVDPFGNYDRLRTSAEQPALELSTIRPKEPIHREIDPGLTLVWLFLKSTTDVEQQLRQRHEAALRTNAKLRVRYNAARIHIGDTRAAVEEVLGQDNLLERNEGGSDFVFYGSQETIRLVYPMHYLPVVVEYRSGVVHGIISGEVAYRYLTDVIYLQRSQAK